jgi:ATP-dependent RNA helicase HelY
VLVTPGSDALESTMTEDLSPAERYAAARLRAAEQATALADFREMYDFGLDPFQIEACQALEAGKGVLVAAPTGSGKTIVGEFAVHLALQQGKKCFYTTPIKALSNQKYADLCRRYGADKVGLLTGDNSVNSEAPVVVMTTEVLRNMLYAGSQTLLGLGYVVMDEVHYLSDRFRGAVWEEVIIHLPESVTLVSLSATVSNAEEFGDWLDTVRGDTEVIVSEHRPVPLFQHVLVGGGCYDLFEEGEGSFAKAVNPDLARLARMEAAADPSYQDRKTRARHARGRPGARARGAPAGLDTGTARVIERLDAEGLLPAITFIFSRAACEAAVQQCLYAGLRLNDDEATEIRCGRSSRSARRPSRRGPACPRVLRVPGRPGARHRGPPRGHAADVQGGRRGAVRARLVKAVFATETLALGINMPARTVVLEKLVKWNGEQHADITPGEYTQLTGRAGRRGIDVEGHAVVLWQRGISPEQVSRVWPAPVRIRCAPASSRRTTWRSTSSSSSGGTGRASCWRRRSRSSRPTSRSSGSRGRCSATRRAWRATRTP